MSYCINPKCSKRLNPDNLAHCQSCGTPLLVHNRYRLVKPLRELDDFSSTDIFEVDDAGSSKVLKVLKRPKFSQMFQREARVLQQLKHSGIPHVEADGYFTVIPKNGPQELHCLVMEKIEGENLEQWLEKYGPVPQSLALDWLRQLTEIIQLLHEKNIFHRDIKPSNIMVRSLFAPNSRFQENRDLVLIDFGTVREIAGTYLAKVGSHGQITGIVSPGYTPPEQAAGKALPQSDFFALGRTFVHLLTEKHPIDLPENPQTGELIWQEYAPQITPAMANFVDELMATLPAKRPLNASIILQRLEEIKNNKLSWVNPPIWMGAIAFVLVGITGFWGARISLAAYYYNRGLENHLARQLDEAEILYKQAIALNPNYSEVHNALGFLCQERQDEACALREYSKAIALAPKSAIAHFNLGNLCEDRKDFNCARTAYRAAMENGLPAATNNLARLYILNKNYQTASQLLSEALERVSDRDTKYAILKNLGWAKMGEKRYPEAEKKLKKAIELKPDSAPAYCLLALVLEERTQQVEAQVEWQNCLRYASVYNPDEAAWINTARDRLNPTGEAP